MRIYENSFSLSAMHIFVVRSVMVEAKVSLPEIESSCNILCSWSTFLSNTWDVVELSSRSPSGTQMDGSTWRERARAMNCRSPWNTISELSGWVSRRLLTSDCSRLKSLLKGSIRAPRNFCLLVTPITNGSKAPIHVGTPFLVFENNQIEFPEPTRFWSKRCRTEPPRWTFTLPVLISPFNLSERYPDLRRHRTQSSYVW